MSQQELPDEVSVVVRVINGTNLPGRDKLKFNPSDPFVQVFFVSNDRKFDKWNKEEYKTEYIPNDSNPIWTYNTFFITEKREVISQKLDKIRFKVMDYDLTSKNDLIGELEIKNIYKDRDSYSLDNSKVITEGLFKIKNGKKKEAGTLSFQIFVVNGPVLPDTKKEIAVKYIKDFLGDKIENKDIDEALKEEADYNPKVTHDKITMIKWFAKKAMQKFAVSCQDLELDENISSCKKAIVTFIANAISFLFTLAGLPGASKKIQRFGEMLLPKVIGENSRVFKKLIKEYKELKKSAIIKRAKKVWKILKQVNKIVEIKEFLQEYVQSFTSVGKIKVVIMCALTVASWFIEGSIGFIIGCVLAIPAAVKLTQYAYIAFKNCLCNNEVNSNQINQIGTKQEIAGTLTIQVLGARNLKDLDFGIRDKSDPFVMVYCYGIEEQPIHFITKTINNNLNPDWDEEFIVNDLDKFKNLTYIEFVVWDHDRFTGHDEIGRFRIMNPQKQDKFQEKNPSTQEEALEYKNKKNRGDLIFKLHFR